MSPSCNWIWSDKITNERVARIGYNHFRSKKGEWNNCFSKFSNRVLPPIFISTILQSVWKESLAHYFSYDVKLRLLAHSRSFLANQKARNAIVGAENLLNSDICLRTLSIPRIEQFSESACSSEENRKLGETDNVQGQISGHIFGANGGYCGYYSSNIFRNARCFENWAISISRNPQF